MRRFCPISQLSCLFFVFSLIATGCESLPAHDFAELKPGMTKREVLSVMGNPQTTDRAHDLDRWRYVFYQDAKLAEKEVHFDHDRAVYIGDHPRPQISAEEQDQIFARENLELAQNHRATREQTSKQLSSYENEIHGDDEIRYVPEFVPVR